MTSLDVSYLYYLFKKSVLMVAVKCDCLLSWQRKALKIHALNDKTVFYLSKLTFTLFFIFLNFLIMKWYMLSFEYLKKLVPKSFHGIQKVTATCGCHKLNAKKCTNCLRISASRQTGSRKSVFNQAVVVHCLHNYTNNYCVYEVVAFFKKIS